METKRIMTLIKKYDNPYVAGERHSSETNKLNKRIQRKAGKHSLCEDLMLECDFFNFSTSEKEFLHYLIDRFADEFKKLHHKAKNEAIILAFMFYVKKLEDSRVNINNYAISKKYGLTDDVFMLVICRMCDNFVKSAPIAYKDTTKYDHEILSKNGGRL